MPIYAHGRTGEALLHGLHGPFYLFLDFGFLLIFDHSQTCVSLSRAIYYFGQWLCYVQFLVCVLFYARCGRSAPAAGAPRPLRGRSAPTRTLPRYARCGPFGPAAGPSGPLRELRNRENSTNR